MAGKFNQMQKLIAVDIENEINELYERGYSDFEILRHLRIKKDDAATMPNEEEVINVFIHTFEERLV